MENIVITDFTDLEQQVINGILNSDYFDGESDKQIWLSSVETKMNNNQRSGAIASLVKKGIVQTQDGDSHTGSSSSIIWFTEKGTQLDVNG